MFNFNSYKNRYCYIVHQHQSLNFIYHNHNSGFEFSVVIIKIVSAQQILDLKSQNQNSSLIYQLTRS